MSKHHRSAIEIILSAIALTAVLLLFAKAFIDVDNNYDVGWYHLPFAARIWGIVPESAFLTEAKIEHRYDGFPLLANFFQGLLWKLTGRVQGANLVGYLSLVSYFFLLRSFFQVPLYLSAIAILAIPAVLTHATSAFVDLPGNVGVSVLMLMLYRFFSQSQLPSKRELLFAVLGAAMAVNTKPQLQPLVFVLYVVAGIRLLWLYFEYTTPGKRRLWLTVPLSFVASILIFATPTKNLVVYGNPLYPIKIEVAGIVLNHQLNPETYSEGDRPQKWLRSILEINTPGWSADQWNAGHDEYLDRAGGFFGAYVVFNCLLLLVLAIREQLVNRQLSQLSDQSRAKSRSATTALIIMLLVSLIPANFPQSHELRYFMFWMITLVSLNLVLISKFAAQFRGRLQVKHAGLVYLLFWTFVWTTISKFYLLPDGRSLDRYLTNNIKQELVEQTVPNQRTCIIARHAINPNAVPFASIANVFFYSAYFHPEVGHDYSLQAAIEPAECGDLTMIPPNAADFIEPADS
ncbi:MAG: hypothetical protein AAFQ23_10950 [Cyanobacteria bacterium J06623_1]